MLITRKETLMVSDSGEEVIMVQSIQMQRIRQISFVDILLGILLGGMIVGVVDDFDMQVNPDIHPIDRNPVFFAFGEPGMGKSARNIEILEG